MPYSRLSNLFPAISPNQSGMLDVGNGHQIYWEECGNPKGVPIVFLHGGPGAGASALHRRFFDPVHYRIILLDQRGCGRSIPTAEIAHNTTPDLVQDLERLRMLLNIDRWYVFGGSWGSTLALAYGVAHPTRSLGFIIRGIFMGQTYEKDWFIHKMGTFYPEEGNAFLNFLEEDERADVLASYVKHLNHPNPEVHMPAAFSWAGYEEACATLLPYHGHSEPDPVLALCLSRLEAHYFQHNFFMKEGYLFENLHKIIHLPCIIIQGRYDVICPPKTAAKLASQWPKAQYIVIPDAGHSAMEPGIRGALVNATQAFKSLSA
jgi:proline iminopeptidase